MTKDSGAGVKDREGRPRCLSSFLRSETGGLRVKHLKQSVCVCVSEKEKSRRDLKTRARGHKFGCRWEGGVPAIGSSGVKGTSSVPLKL